MKITGVKICEILTRTDGILTRKDSTARGRCRCYNVREPSVAMVHTKVRLFYHLAHVQWPIEKLNLMH